MSDDTAQGTDSVVIDGVAGKLAEKHYKQLKMQNAHLMTQCDAMQEHIDSQQQTIRALTETLRLLITQQAKPKPAPRVRKRKPAAAKD